MTEATMTPLAKAARTITGLYNHARPLGLGILHFVPGKMSPKDALTLAREGAEDSQQRIYMDYVRGRVIKVVVNCVTGEVVQGERLYDRDNGDGEFARAVADGLADPFYAELDGVEL